MGRSLVAPDEVLPLRAQSAAFGMQVRGVIGMTALGSTSDVDLPLAMRTRMFLHA